jgi:hypothetical protein
VIRLIELLRLGTVVIRHQHGQRPAAAAAVRDRRLRRRVADRPRSGDRQIRLGAGRDQDPQRWRSTGPPRRARSSSTGSSATGRGCPDGIWYRAFLNFDSPAGWTGIERALTHYHATSILIYQPASQFWQLQAMESAGLFTVALLFGAAAVWLVRRRET